MVDSAETTRPRRPTRRRTIPTRTPTKRAASRRSGGRAAGKAPRPPRKATRRRRPSPRAEQPLGAGVVDAFAFQRLKVPAATRRSRSGVREIGWAEFGRLSAELASQIAATYRPDVVVGIADAGVFVGGALAPALGAELVHLHLPGRGSETEKLPTLSGKRVLVVDDAADTGKTLAKASALARKSRAAEVRTAVIVLKPGGAAPDWHAIRTDEVVVFGWDYQSHGGYGHGDPGETGV